MVKAEYITLLKRVLFSLSLFIFYRAFFGIYNYNYFQGISSFKIFQAFLLGFRFDLATALITNLFFILFSIIPFRAFWYKRFLKLIFVIFNSIFLTIIIVDIEFFAFIGKKMSFDILDLGQDIENQLPQLIKNYWFFVLLILSNIFILYKFYPRVSKGIFQAQKISLLKAVPVSFIILVLVAVGIRGGVQLRSLSPKNAFVFEEYELGNLSLNAAYTMVRSFGKKGLKKETFFKNDKLAKDFILNNKSFKTHYNANLSNQNVIIIIIESLSQEYIEKGYTPFFNELIGKSLYFKNNMANGRRSIEALPSILTGIPSLLKKPLSQSQYQSNQFFSLPGYLSENGYKTSFFHGGKRGTMDFDAYCRSIGISEYHAMEDYPDKRHFDGQWGIFDHHFYKYFADKLSQYKEPFFSTFFSLSSHQPYTIPPLYKNRFPKGKLDIHESIGYADESLREFFSRAEKEKWFKNTLFVITADHTQKLESNEFNSELGRYRVPLLFYHPQKNLSDLQRERATQHADIQPSILDFLNIESKKKLLFGSSVFSNEQGSSINFLSGNYFFINKRNYIRFDKNRAHQYNIEEDFLTLRPTKVDSSDLKLLKAFIQYTNNGLKNNKIYQ